MLDDCQQRNHANFADDDIKKLIDYARTHRTITVHGRCGHTLSLYQNEIDNKDDK